MSLSQSLSVRLTARRTRKPHRPNFANFYAYRLWPWLGPFLPALRCVMYFRFCRWRPVFKPSSHRARIKHDVMFREFARWRHQWDVKTTTAFGRVDQNAAP